MTHEEIIAWFDVHDWALTPFELHAASGERHTLDHTNGFLHLTGREELAWVRRRKSIWAWRKLKKARWWSRVLQRVPFVRMIAVGNALGYGNCHEESDIDFVIVSAPGRIWTVRLLTVALLRMFRQRPGEHARDAICPSFFLTTDALNVEQLQIEERTMQHGECKTSDPDHASFCIHHVAFPRDPYLLFWVTQLTVLYDDAGTYAAFWRANEHWVRQWLPDMRPRGAHPRWCRTHAARSPPNSTIVEFGGLGMSIGDAIERWAKRFQERWFSQVLRNAAEAPGTDVVIGDAMLKFHLNDRRAEYRERWMQRLAANERFVSV